MQRTDWEADDIRLILWDETNESGFFGGNGTVAITPIFFFSNGVIADADILFNGGDFRFTTSNQPGRFDIQTVATHELGHLIGLDHTGWAGATMFPFVDTTVELQRSISLDERAGIRHIYPNAGFARITGFVRRSSDETGVSGAHVVARDASGRPAGGTLTELNGSFTISGMEPGTYTVYASPFEGVVAMDNIGEGNVVETDFEATVHPTPIDLLAGQTQSLGDLVVGPNVAVVLGIGQIVYPVRAIAGMNTAVTIRGVGLSAGSTLEASDPTIALSNVNFSGNQVTFLAGVPASEEPGHFDLTVTTLGGGTSILTAPIEVTPADPVV